jgi:ABC-type nitrate/sulfonate/bicarbonate transport system substrate-binding protein
MNPPDLDPRVAARRRVLTGLGASSIWGLLSGTRLDPIAAAFAQGATRTLDTALAWIPNHQFAGFWIGLDKGWFDEAGVKVNWRPGGPNTPNPVERVASGEIGLGQQSGPRPVLDAIVKGNDFVVLGTRFQRQPGGLLSLAKNPVLEAKDMVGKRIIAPNPTDVRTIEIALKANKLPVKFQYVPGGSDPQALLDGQGDAMIAFVTNQAIGLERKGLVKDKDFFHRSWDDLGMPNYSNFLFATRRYVADNRETLVRYLRTEIRGWQENEKDPGYGARLAVEKYGVDFGLDLKQETRSSELQQPFLHSKDTDENGLFWINRDRLGGPIYDALRAGGVEKLPDVDRILDMSLLRDARKS